MGMGYTRGRKDLIYLEDAIPRGWEGSFRSLRELVTLLGCREHKGGRGKRCKVACRGRRKKCQYMGERIRNKCSLKLPVASEVFMESRFALVLAADTEMAKHQAWLMVQNAAAGPASPEIWMALVAAQTWQVQEHHRVLLTNSKICWTNRWQHRHKPANNSGTIWHRW